MTTIELQEKLSTPTKYSKYYLQIIERAKLDNRVKLKKDNKDYIYYENHHILPRSIFPEYSKLKEHSWNGVLLTAREHYLCHALIWKHYKKLGMKKEMYKMGRAFQLMQYLKDNNQQRYNSKLYEMCKVNMKLDMNIINKIKNTLKNTDYNIKKNRVSKRLKTMNNKSYKEKQKISDKMSKSAKNRFNNMNEEEKELYKKRLKEGHKNRSIEEKQKTSDKMSKSRSGSLNNSASIILIYNKYNKVEFICNDDFKQICDFYNLPFRAFQRSYIQNIKLYETEQAKTKARKNKNDLFIDWYAIKLP